MEKVFLLCKAMEPNSGDPFEPSLSSSSSCCSTRDDKVDEESVNDLLEECWFFENLFKRKTRMLRCYSDPCCPTSDVSQEILTKDSDNQSSGSAKNKIPPGDGVVQGDLIPPCTGRKEEEAQVKESNKLTRQSSHQHLLQALPKPASAGKNVTRRRLDGQPSRPNLRRAPSLPSYFVVSQDKEESDTRMSKLIQQAFANSSDILQKSRTSKGLTRSYSISRPPRSSDHVEINQNMNGIREMSRRYHLNQSKSRKSASDLESEEVQGFKDLGFTFEKQELSPSVINILPGLQEKNNREELNQDHNMRRPYLSEAWLSQSYSPPPVPNWATKNSPEDMKAQIKFWARAVASNVRQEC